MTEMTKPGDTMWHTSEADGGGPDVGIEVMLNANQRLYAGEVPGSPGWSIALRNGSDRVLITADVDARSSREMIEAVALSLRNAAKSSAHKRRLTPLKVRPLEWRQEDGSWIAPDDIGLGFDQFVVFYAAGKWHAGAREWTSRDHDNEDAAKTACYEACQDRLWGGLELAPSMTHLIEAAYREGYGDGRHEPGQAGRDQDKIRWKASGSRANCERHKAHGLEQTPVMVTMLQWRGDMAKWGGLHYTVSAYWGENQDDRSKGPEGWFAAEHTTRDVIPGLHPNEEAAKAAAQTHFDDYICSALMPQS